MSTYRLERNTEASLIDYIVAQLLADSWTGISVLKVFAEVYGGSFPAILVNVSERPDTRRELGSNSLNNFVNIEIRLFCENDGQRLDLADWILPKIMAGLNYYTYVIVNGAVQSKTLAGRISVLELIANRKELKMTDTTSVEDRYRHLLSFRCRVALS